MNENQTLQTEEVVTQLEGLNEQLEQEKVELTPEVEAYIEENVKKVHEKLTAKEDIFASDLEFIQNISDWIDLTDKYRKKYPTIEELIEADHYIEANKRGLKVDQWADLMHLIKVLKMDVSWLDSTFQFKSGKIIVNYNLKLNEQNLLTRLPRGMVFKGSLYLNKCALLEAIPEDLEVGDSLYAANCPKLKIISKGLKVKNDIEFQNSNALERFENKELKVRKLNLDNCTSLVNLPDNLQAYSYIYLSGCIALEELPSKFTAEFVAGSVDMKPKTKDKLREFDRQGTIGQLDIIDYSELT